MVLQLMALPVWLVSLVQIALVPFCFAVAWSMIGLTLWNLVVTIRDGVNRATVMHKIPCAECRYFTNDHRLKCPIHPKIALSESAIDCPDFEDLGLG
ncbi:hypothetical protein H6F59_08560 [Nodosilinea sp. FACHB-141]|uniref:Uncharacterized protein n=1 Tax=Leptolyngbya subtilissima DQ-A4 TaxID=2933933 RepID=A0ABV0JXI6_9CYAN|nr:hypothetical protein [Nodosilinea sp. FACHB-141]MBD2111878.1 hypothetical protein [Nodosilinea sp. FACHB-141]